MRLEITRNLVQRRYHVEIRVPASGAFTPVEQEALRRVGEPVISCGGEFTDGDAITFTLGTNDRKFPSSFPVKQVFSLIDDENAGDHAQVWETVMKERITEGMRTIRAVLAASDSSSIADIDTSPVG